MTTDEWTRAYNRHARKVDRLDAKAIELWDTRHGLTTDESFTVVDGEYYYIRLSKQAMAASEAANKASTAFYRWLSTHPASACTRN